MQFRGNVGSSWRSHDRFIAIGAHDSCALNNSPGPDHPTLRRKAADREQAIVDELKRLRIPSPELSQWFRSALEANLSDLLSHQRRRSVALTKRKSELAAMQDRLLNAYLAGTVDGIRPADTSQVACVRAWAGSPRC